MQSSFKYIADTLVRLSIENVAVMIVNLILSSAIMGWIIDAPNSPSATRFEIVVITLGIALVLPLIYIAGAHAFRTYKKRDNDINKTQQIENTAGTLKNNLEKKTAIPVSMTFEGQWLNTPFRLAEIGKDENHEMIYGEDLYLTITNSERLQNTSLQLVKKQTDRNKRSTELLYKSAYFGNIPRGYKKDILIFRRKFKIVQDREPNELSNGNTHFRKRKDIGAALIDGDEKEYPVTQGLLSIELILYHESGPTKANFTIDLDEVETPRTRIVIPENQVLTSNNTNSFLKPALPMTRVY